MCSVKNGETVLVLGAGAIVIGQGCEFDYSGTQACRQLKRAGLRVVLVNPNPATIMTDKDVADRTYVEPLTVDSVQAVIERERPWALLPIVGGQTALNLTIALSERGVLDKYNIKMLGVDVNTIINAEDRREFKKLVEQLGFSCPRSIIVTNEAEAENAINEIGFPIIVRPSFTLGGLGGGIAYNRTEYKSMVIEALTLSPQIQMDQSLIGWKEYELELIIDASGNCVVVCAIENIDPMGVHTGDSVTVTPIMTLTDKEYQRMRDTAIKIMRAVGLRGGGANVQFAVNPLTGEQSVIEMNPRVSRSSALASKATGFPIAKVSAMLALGHSLDCVSNECTGLPAAFEPALDYVVIKMPGFDFKKFDTPDILSTSMRATGEVMALGADFKQALQKALCSLERGFCGLDSIITSTVNADYLCNNLSVFRENKILYIADALRMGLDTREAARLTLCDKWFIDQIAGIVAVEQSLHSLDAIDGNAMFQLKKSGLSDARIAKLTGTTWSDVMNKRVDLGIQPVFRRVDTCAAEFVTQVTYMYSCYVGSLRDTVFCESKPTDREKVVILGNGCTRIGQGIEFDYACVHACMAAKESGYETIMINSNPSTVSTDYDVSDRLYVEPMTYEHVLNILRKESENGKIAGVIVQMGGQTPLKLGKVIDGFGYKILGTQVKFIDFAEDREKFYRLLKTLGFCSPPSFVIHETCELKDAATSLGFPVLLRPSYVLGGDSMSVIHDENELEMYIQNYPDIFDHGPLLVDKFLAGAIEVDVEVISDGAEAYVIGIMEHIEVAGVHSGDSACSMPPRSISPGIIRIMSEQAQQLAKTLNVIGFLNIQYAIKDNLPYILEANPRASRTIPFVAKALGVHVAGIATQVMLGKKLRDVWPICPRREDNIAVKIPVFPFNKFCGAETILGPQMRSTGETMGIDRAFGAAFAKAYIAAGNKLPTSGKVFISISNNDKNDVAVTVVRKLTDMGFSVCATSGTADFLAETGIKVDIVNKVRQGRPHILDALINNEIVLIINTTEGLQSIKDSHSIRRTAVMTGVPCVTTMRGAEAIVDAVKSVGDISVVALQDL